MFGAVFSSSFGTRVCVSVSVLVRDGDKARKVSCSKSARTLPAMVATDVFFLLCVF